jgi:hypothetical protein
MDAVGVWTDSGAWYESEVSANNPPIANAGANQTGVEAGSQVQLSASNSSDNDGAITTYLWEQTGGDAVTLSDPSISSPVFTAPSTDVNQTLTFQLTVTDNNGSTDPDTVNIYVLNQNYEAPENMFRINDLELKSKKSNRTSDIYGYITEDTLAEVLDPGYFDDPRAALDEGDMVIVRASDANMVCFAISPVTVVKLDLL